MKRWVLFGTLILLASGAGYYLGRFRNSGANESNAILYYVDPMHPAYRSNKPGIAPDCGMDLVPVYAKDLRQSVASAQPSPGEVKIDSGARQLYGISLAKVERSSGQGSLRVFGRVAADDTRVYRLNIGTAGFVKSTHNDAVGDHVKKDQRLATIYSSELIYAVTGFLSGNERIPGAGMRDNAATPNATSSQNRADYLRNLGMSEAQITELRATKKIPEDIYIESPADGFIVSRNISPGLRYEKNTEFYRIADLSHVWVFAEVFGKDVKAFRPGAVVHVTLPATGETFVAHVSDALPEIDPVTRTLKVRLEVENPGLRLRPDMYVNVDIPTQQSPGLTVPVDAVLDSGLSKRVFVQTTEGRFEARTVEVGWRSSERAQILKGLKDGETVVSSGTFLVDSESRLQMAANDSHKPDGDPHRDATAHAHAE